MTRFWPRATAFFGLATLALLIAFSLLPSVRAAYPHGEFPEAMSDFQRAVSTADLAHIFDDPPRADRISAMQEANRLDLYAFIPAYSLFLIAGAAMLAGGFRRSVWVAVIPVLGGATGDILETSHQLAVLHNWRDAWAALPIAPVYWMKNIGLALSAAGSALLAYQAEPRRTILAALGLVPTAVILVALVKMASIPSLMTIAFAAFWLPLWIIALNESFAPRAA